MATQGLYTGSKSRALGSSDELAVIAQRAQAFTNASGAAIALSNGSASEIICRARSGSSAPDVGAIMRVEGAFTGLCIQSGKELRCDDADTDTRVDTAGMRALGIRSMVVTPIKEEDQVLGVVVVFASAAYAFSITHLAVLSSPIPGVSDTDGFVPNPQHLGRAQRDLRRASQRVSRRVGPDRRVGQRPSKRWEKANQQRNTIHHRVANLRQDGLHKPPPAWPPRSESWWSRT